MPRRTNDGYPPLAGQLLADRYRLDAPIEARGADEVWSARDTVLNRPVAVKLINQEHAGDEAFVSRFRAESRHAAALSHSGVAQVFDYGENEGTALPCPYLVMEHVSGRPLSELLAKAGALSADLVLDITAQAARALQAAHDIGITHRNVRPANLLVTDDGWVKLTDFSVGAASPESQVATVSDAEVVRAAAYLAPEQDEGKPTTTASDIYSLGVIAYECLTGRLPHSGATARELAAARAAGEPRPLPDQIPAGLSDLVMRMIATDPFLRPGTALAVAETASVLRDEIVAPTLAEPAGWAAPPAADPNATAMESPSTAFASPATAFESRADVVDSGGAAAMESRAGAMDGGAGAADTGADPLTSTAPQPVVPGVRARSSRRRQRRTLAAAAVALGVTALCGTIAAMMSGGKPPGPISKPVHTYPPPAAQGMIPAHSPTAHPAKTGARREAPATVPSRSKTASARPSATATPSRTPTSTPTRTRSAPPPTKTPTATPTAPTPTGTPTAPASSGQSGSGTPPSP